MNQRTPLAVALLLSPLLGCGGSARTTSDSAQGGFAGRAASGGTGNVAGAVSAAGSGGAISNAGSAGSTGNASLVPGSWDVSARISATGEALYGDCAGVEFTLNISPDQRITLGRDGQIDSGPVTPIANGYLAESLVLPTTGAGCTANALQVENLRLVGLDQDGDGRADQLMGSATGMIQFIGGDVAFTNAVSVELSGDPDRTAPALALPQGSFNSLDLPTFRATEPLDLSATSLELSGTSGTQLVELVPLAGALPFSAIRWETGVILPLSGEWQLTGKGRDLIGLELNSTGTVRTLVDPGLFEQDGFEGELHAAVEAGKPTLVNGIGDLPAIEGTRSLWLDPGASLTFHLRRKAAESSLHFSIRAFGNSASSVYFNKSIRVGVIGTKEVTQVYVPSSEQPGASTGDAKFPWASPVIEMSTPLDADGSDVLVSFSDYYCGGGLCPPPPVVMIDSLTLQ